MNIIESKKTYIHYGSKLFDPTKGYPIKNHIFVKPSGGLWASPADSKRTWLDWCIEEDFRTYEPDNYFRFKLKPNNRILTIKTEDDIIDAPFQNIEGISDRYRCLDFEKLLSMGIDGVEITINGFTYYDFYGWDCDSIVVLNPNCVEVIE